MASENNKIDEKSSLIASAGVAFASGWTHSSDTSYVCFLHIGSTSYPVTAFTLESSTSNQFSLEVLFLSKSALTYDSVNEKSATLKLFYNEYTRSYQKEVTATIRKFYNQGEAFLLTEIVYSSKPDNFYLYKVVLYPDMYKLTLKTSNRIFRDPEENTTLHTAKSVLDEYHISYSCEAVCETKKASITQYQETDYNFLMRMIEDSNCICYYNFSFTTPKFVIVENSSYVLSVSLPGTITRPANVKNGYKEGELISIFVDQDYFFVAKVCSCTLFAGDSFVLGSDLSTRYFITSNLMTFSYVKDSWVVVNEFKGFVLLKAKSYLIRTQSMPLIPGIIRGVVVSEQKDTFHVNDDGSVQVRLLWKKESSGSSVGSVFERIEEAEESVAANLWDLNHESRDVTTWAPVSQWGSAGEAFGNCSLPRAGQEVLVWFYEGNPDKPVVIGSVYTKQNPFPNTSGAMDFSSTTSLFEETRNIESSIQSQSAKATDLIDLRSIASDYPETLPAINVAAPNVMFKHFSYDKEKGTKSDRYNSIAMFNNFEEEKLMFHSSNLVDIRSGKDMHTLVKDTSRSVISKEVSSFLNERSEYLFGDDSYSVLNANRYSYFLSFSSKKSVAQEALLEGGGLLGGKNAEDALFGNSEGEVTEAEMLARKSAKQKLAKSLIVAFASPGSFDLAVYDLATCARVFFAGALVNFLMLGGISNVCAAGTYSVMANCISMTALGTFSMSCYGKFSLSCVGPASMSFSRLSFSVGGNAGVKFGSLDLKAGSTEITFGKTKLKAGDLSAQASSMDVDLAKLDMKVADSVQLKSTKFSIECAEFSLKAPKITIEATASLEVSCTAVFTLKSGARIAISAPLIQLG